MADEMVCVGSYDNAIEAELVLARLQAAELPAFLQGENTASTFAGINGMGARIRLYVNARYLKQVKDILAFLREERRLPSDWEQTVDFEEGVWLCPTCGDAVDESDLECRDCGTKRDLIREE
jgi:rubrerythrin